MNRRSLFSALVGMGAGTAVAAASKPNQTNPYPADPVGVQPDRVRWEGRTGLWEIEWSGWIPSCSSSTIFGRYVAAPIMVAGSADEYRPCVYSSYPGRCSIFFRGEIFDVGCREGQIYLDHGSSQDDFLEAKVQSGRTLMDYLKNLEQIDWRPNSEDETISLYARGRHYYWGHKYDKPGAHELDWLKAERPFVG